MGQVLYMGDPDRHFWITRSVARAMGLHMGRALDDGQLDVAGYGDLVTRCRMCGRADTCESWLGRQRPGQAAAAPPDCPNAGRFAALIEAQASARG